MSVLGTATPVPTDAVPCKTTTPGGETFTAPSGGAVMSTEIDVPPGRLPSSARADRTPVPDNERRVTATPTRTRPLPILILLRVTTRWVFESTLNPALLPLRT